MTFGIFGYRHVTKVLRCEGMVVNRKKVRRLMDIMGVKAIFPSPKTSVKNVGHKIYDYLLEDLTIDRPNQVWQVDITYIRTRKGFAYLTACIDVYSGWSLSHTMDSSFCLDALNKSLEQGLPEIINSDQGTQFTSEVWINSLKDHGIAISMTGKGRCIDNVYIERFWRSIKHEKIKLCEFDDIDDLENLIADYISHYNCERPHQSLGEGV
jgi:putative transposase